MASLSIRNLDDKVYKNLRLRAAKHGVSMEEEVRQILIKLIEPQESIVDIFRKHFGEENGVDLELPPREPHEPMDFSKW